MKSARVILGLVVLIGLDANAAPERRAADNESSAAASVAPNATSLTALAAPAPSTNPVVLVDFRLLKALLPTELKNLERRSSSGERFTRMGTSASFAKAEYGHEKETTVEIKISDLGGMSSLMLQAQADWIENEIDRETDSGYEKTTLFGHFKGHERYDQQEKSGEIQVFVAGRFLVEIGGDQADIGLLKSALARIDLNKLAALNPLYQPPAKVTDRKEERATTTGDTASATGPAAESATTAAVVAVTNQTILEEDRTTLPPSSPNAQNQTGNPSFTDGVRLLVAPSNAVGSEHSATNVPAP